MNGQDFKKEIQSNPKNIYCLVSSDSGIIDLYINRFKNAIQADKVIYGEIRSYGRLFNKKTLCVIYNNKLSDEIFERKEYIFIHTDKIDKRSSIYKKYKDRFIEVSNDYTDFVMSHGNMTEQQAKDFIKKCNNDLGIIKNTLTQYELSDLEYNDFVDYSSDIYNWVDCFIKGDKLPKCNESPISMLALLATNCTNILKIKQNDATDLNPYVKKCLMSFVDYRTTDELASIISDCFILDTKIKQGLIDINYVINYLIINNYHKKGN